MKGFMDALNRYLGRADALLWEGWQGGFSICQDFNPYILFMYVLHLAKEGPGRFGDL